MVPVEHIQDGKIILNIAPMAINGLTLGDDAVTFSARFSGNTEAIYVPVDAVLAIYSKENGQGMMFSEDSDSASMSESKSKPEDTDPDPDPSPDRPTGPRLRVVK